MIEYVVKFIIFIVITAGTQAQFSNHNIPSSLEMDFPYINIPEKCRNVNDILNKPYECCVMPRLFPEDTIIKCFINKLNATQVSSESVEVQCSQKLCLLETHNMLENNFTIDSDALAYYLETVWAENNPTYADALENLKERCGVVTIPSYSDVCIADRLIICYASVLAFVCPVWIPTESCNQFKEFMDVCKRFLTRY